MKRRVTVFCCLVAATLFAPSSARAEILELPADALQIEYSKSTPTAMGAGYLQREQVECLTEEARAAIRTQIQFNRERLNLAPKGPGVSFEWPVRPSASNDDYGVHGISNFVDQDVRFPDLLRDYNCGTRSYDLSSGYNHKGTDIFTWPFSWLQMQNDTAAVVAAAAGTIVSKSDGNFDQNCGFGSGSWNAIYVEHSDGSGAWYGHMKNGSLTAKGIGATVVEGEYLGVVGSSGNSTGPHLHFEVYDSLGNLIDPYAGPCNSLNANGWWTSQRPYYDSAVNAVRTQTAGPVFPSCPQVETSNFSDQYDPGDSIVFATYYRDQLQGQVSEYRVYRPDNSVFASWSASLGVPHYAASYWWWTYNLGVGEQEGTWRFEVTYEGQAYVREFTVGDVVAVDTPLAPRRLAPAFPNPLNPTTNIAFELERAENVRVDIVDLAGRLVTRIHEGQLAAGSHRLQWDGRDGAGRTVASGVYVIKLGTASGVESRKIAVTK